MTKYPVYFEVEWYCEPDGENVKEGGFIHAEDYIDAMKQIYELYKDDIVNVKLELMDDCALILPFDKARHVKDIIDTI